MKKLWGVILGIVLAMGMVNAQTLTNADVKSNMEQVLLTQYYNGLTGFDVEVKILNLPFSEINIPDGKIYYEVASPKDRYLPRDVKRINLYVGGMLVKVFNVPVEKIFSLEDNGNDY